MRINIAGGTYEHPSQDVNFQRCINMFPSFGGLSPRDPEARAPIVLLPTAGKKELVDLSGDEVRALINFDDTVYAVVDSTLYKLTINEDAETATGSNVGTITTTTEGRMNWARNPTQIFLTDGTTSGGYIHTVSTDTLTQISDTDFTGASSIVFMDSYFLYNTPDASTMFATAVNDGSSVDALDVVTAEGQPDKLVGLAVDKRELWAFGEKSVEIWYNAANATGFPFSRREGAFIDQGCAARDSILNFDNRLVWLDDRGYVVTSSGYGLEVISNAAVNNAIREYDTISDAFAFQYTDRGHLFYVITFPSEDETWVYDATTTLWHQQAYFRPNNDFERDLSNCHVRYKQWDLVGDRQSGKIYIVKSDTYKDGDDLIHRLRTTAPQNLEFKQLSVDELELRVETGKALTSGTGSDPKIMMRYSQDGGYSWSNELERSIGKLGEYDKRIRWNRLGSGNEWIFEFRVSSPIKFSIIDASAEVSGGLT